MKMIRDFKIWFYKFIPKIHNLPKVIYINWCGYEWFIEKQRGRRY